MAEWGPLGPGVQWPESQARLRERGAGRLPGHAGHHRLHRRRRARRADHARPQRQRLLRLDLRCAARRLRDSDLDRRRRRAVRRSAPRARRHRHRCAVLQRGDGAGVLRRQGHPPADHGAGGRARAIPIWIRNTFAPEKAGTLICAQPTSALPGQGHHQHRARRAGEPRGHRHDRRAGHRAPPVRRAARGGHLGHPDLAGQLRALDLLRDPAGAGASRRPPVVRRAFERELAGRPDPERRRRSATWRSSRWSATAWPARRASRRRCSPRSASSRVNVRAIAQGASERNISVVVDGRSAMRALRAVHAGLLPVAAHHLDRRHRPGHGGAGAARSARRADRAAARAIPARPARARHHRLAAHGAGRHRRDRARLARAVRGECDGRRPRALRRARPASTTCRTRCWSTAPRAPRWRRTTPTGSPPASTS